MKLEDISFVLKDNIGIFRCVLPNGSFFSEQINWGDAHLVYSKKLNGESLEYYYKKRIINLLKDVCSS